MGDTAGRCNDSRCYFFDSLRERGIVKTEQIEFTNRWMFNRVVCNEEVCRSLIRVLLGIDVGELEYLNAEQSYEPGFESRGVRMDVVAKGGGCTYDIEMQLADEPGIGKRMRYYQSALDAGDLTRGDDCEKLPESHIIFICMFDPYREGLPVYTFDRMCQECPKLNAGDCSHWHVLNASAWELAEDEGVRSVLEYVSTGAVTGPLSRKIDGLVARYNEDRKWVGRVVTLEQDMRMRCRWAEERGRQEGLEEGLAKGIEQGIEQGVARGREEGERRFAALVARLAAEGRSGEIVCAAKDDSFRAKLLREFRL